jgi:hypothetical protein
VQRTMADPAAWATTARDVGATGLLAFALIGGYRRWWVWGWTYDAMERDRDVWKTTALQALHVAEKVIKP